MRLFQDEFPVGTYKGQREAGYPIDAIVLKNLEYMKKSVLTKNNDLCICVDGRVGVGKSTFTFQIAKYLDPTFTLDRVAFTPEDFLKYLRDATKGQAVVLDEAYLVGSRYAMSEYNKKVVAAMSQIRSKNLFIIFVLPSIFDLDRNLTLYRVNMLFHCYLSGSGKRGRYSVYFENKIKDLYFKGKKFYSYPTIPNHRTHFSSCFIFNVKDYEDKKQVAVNQIQIRTGSGNRRYQKQDHKLIIYFKDELKWSFKKIADYVGASEEQIRMRYHSDSAPIEAII